MKYVQRVLFVIAFVFLSVHCLRLTFQLWFEPRTSALDTYDERVEVDIREAESLAELVQRYDAAHKLVKDYEANETNAEVEFSDRDETEPYKSERKLRAGIEEWEEKSHQIARTRTYWVFGFIFLLLGIMAHRWLNPWLGLAALIVAFSEMIYWSSPAYFGGRSQEFERLLLNKLSLGCASFLLLLVASLAIGAIRRDATRSRNAS